MKYSIAIGVALTSISLSAAERMVIDSHKIDRPIVVDGNSGEWPGPLVPLGEQSPVAIAVANDARNLYLVLTASDAATRRQIMREGLVVWFDPGGKDKKHYGIKFPVGAPIEFGGRGRGSRGEPREPGEPRDRTAPPPSDAQQLEEPVNRLEILGEKKDDVHSYVLEFAPGVSVKVAQAEGLLTYELKVPLATSGDVPLAIGAKPGATIGLGLETPKRELPKMEGERGRGMGGFGGGMGGGGMGGRGGGMGGGRGGGRGGDEGRGGFEQARPMKTWVTVHLSA